jgi:hypothetical protein
MVSTLAGDPVEQELEHLNATWHAGIRESVYIHWRLYIRQEYHGGGRGGDDSLTDWFDLFDLIYIIDLISLIWFFLVSFNWFDLIDSIYLIALIDLTWRDLIWFDLMRLD